MDYASFEVGPEEIQELVKRGAWLLDVREPWEFEVCSIAGSNHLPMGQIPNSLDKLPKDKLIITICHHGVRSLDVALYLHDMGFPQVKSMRGGVDAYAWEVDKTMAKY